MRSVKLEQAKEVTKLRQEVEQGAKELASKYERKMKVGLLYELYTLNDCQQVFYSWEMLLPRIMSAR